MLTIIQDTQEQIPFEFSDNVNVVIEKLPFGDYSLPGLELRVTIERKSLSDLVESITDARPRFARLLKALRRFDFAALVIEADWSELENGEYRSKTQPRSVTGSILSFVIDYRVEVILAGTHARGGEITERLLGFYAKRIEEAHKKLHKHQKQAPATPGE